MILYIWHKTLQLLTLLMGVSVISFTLVSFSPIDPIQAYIGDDVLKISPHQRIRIEERWGLHESPPVRFIKWLGQIFKGNLGYSNIYNKPVAEIICEKFFLSFCLMALAWTFSGIFGYILGLVAGGFKGSLIDRIIRFYAYTLASAPSFWIGMVLLVVFSVHLQISPVGGAAPPGKLISEASLGEWLQHLFLPAITLSVIGIANITLHTRQKLIEVLRSDYALFAFAQGEKTWGVILNHGIRNTLLPVLTLQFASFSELFGGAVLAEQVFSYPGLGFTTVQAGLRSDVPLLLGIVLFSAVFVFSGNTLADIVYRWVDPRIRIGDTL